MNTNHPDFLNRSWPVLGLLAGLTLTACGGGGSGDASTPLSPTPTPTTPTPTPPPATASATEKAVASSAVLLSLVQKVGGNFDSGGTTNRAARAKFSQACNGGGQITLADDGTREDVGSPYTTAAFDVFGVEFQSCTIEPEDESGVLTTGDGLLRTGAPANGDESIAFVGFGDATGGFSSLTRVEEGDQFLETDTVLRGVLHSRFAEDGNQVDLAQILTLSGRVSSNDPSFTGSTEFTSILGTPNAPFAFSTRVVGNLLELSISGELGFSSPTLPAECNSDTSIFDTLQPLTVAEDGALGGRIAVTTGGNRAEVQFNSDGSTEVFVDGQQQMFSPDELAALTAACDQSGEAFSFGLGFALGFASGF
ncbi:MAG: hypothetical protein ABF296_13125 [Oceanococcaceae bacterium]